MNIKNKLKTVISLATICAAAVFMNGCSEKENNQYADLKGYLYIYNVGEYEGAAVIIDGDTGEKGFVADGKYYVSYDMVRENIDDRFYWDDTEKVLTYASSRHIYDAVAGRAEYTVDGAVNAYDSAVVLNVEEKAYINVDYVMLMNGSADIKTYSEPDRIVVNIKDTASFVTVKKDAKLRTDSGVTYSIADDLKKDEELYFVEEKGSWSYVYGEDGIMGYVETSKVTEPEEKAIERGQSWLDTEPYTYLTSDGKICLGWHQMEYEAGNDTLGSVIAGAEHVNVISPTWFKLTDNYGGISSLASTSHVDKAHNSGMQVWGLISDFNYDEEGNYYVNQVVSVTSSRRTLIENLINEAKDCGMDGINIDFEKVRLAAGEGYVQFIRELAIECDKESLVLSVDMYTPTENNQYYDRQSVSEAADYLIIMGYDEHWAGCGQAGSVASLPFVTAGIANTISQADASRVINAIPFYTRVWYEDTLENAPEGSVVVEDPVNGDYALSSKAVGMGTAKELLQDNGAGLRWLEDLGQYYGEYYIDGRLARIWLEDKESLTAKLNVMEQNNLAGVACWKLGLESDEAWEAIGEYME